MQIYIMQRKGDFMQKGKIIILNGVSSSGKTTLAKTLQERLNEPFFWIGGDAFIDMMPEKFYNEDCVLLGKTVSILHHTIKVFSDRELNAIFDCVFEETAWMEECVELLREYPVLFVHVTCPLEELQRREKERGDRGIGLAEAQIPLLNPKDNTYDITVDTHNNSKEECADMIIDMLNYPENFTAFKTLWSQRTN